MQLGFFTMPLHPPGSDVTQTLDDDLEQLVTVDRLGYREAWIGEHFTARWENIPAPDLFIASALPRTEQIIFGTGVSCMPNHDPFVLAHRIAQLDHMAKGRFYWGVGSGGFLGDFQVAGFDPSSGDQRSMTREAIDQVLALWDQPAPGLYDHQHWRFTVPEPVEHIGLGVHLKPFQLPHPPIAVAGVSARSDTLLLAGERGWIPISINLVPTRILATHWESVRQGARAAGRTPDRSTWRIARDIYIAETTEQARQEALDGTLGRDFRQYWMRMLAYSGRLGNMKVDPDMPDAAVTPEYALDNIWIVGSPDDAAAKIRRLYEDVGGFGVLLAIGHEWRPEDKWRRSTTLLAEKVMPRLADLG